MPRSNTTPLRGKPSDSGASASSGAGGASSSVGGRRAWDSNEPPQNVVNALQLNLMRETMEGRIALRPGDVAAKGGGTKNTTLYRAMQMEYMRWHGANPNNPGMLRGVELSKRTWKPNAEGPMVSRNWVVLFAQEVYTKGYKFLSGRKKTQYDPSALWWKIFYQTQCYNKTLPNDSDRTYGAKRKKRNAGGEPGSSSSRKQPEALTWLGSLDKMLHALEDLKTQQLNTDPAWCAKVYTTDESKQLLRPGKKGGQKDPRFAAIKVLMQNRQKSSDAGKERDKFSDTLVDSLTFDKHLEMLNWYMERGTYAGALQAMNAAAKFVAALRPSDTRALVLSDMGVDLTGQIVKMPWLENHPVLGFLYLGKNADTNKSEMSFYLPHMRDEANLFFYKGHYFFWRWKILNGLQPDFSPLDEAESQVCASADGAASSAGGGAGATSSSTSCANCASAGCTCPIGGRWYHQRVLANAVHNRVVPTANIPNSTLTEANAKCMQDTGADKQTTKKTACQRRLASIYLDGKPSMTDDHLGAFLHHAPKSTARAHYAIGFPLDCVVGIAGCENLEGKDYDRISGLLGAKLRASRLMLEGQLLEPSSHVPEYPTLVYSTLPPWFKKWHLRLLLSNESCITNNQRRFMDDLYESMAQFVEAAARFRIDNVHQDYVFYGYPPFNIRGGEFDKFVVALANAIEARRPERENLRRTHRFLEVGSVGEAMNSAAKSQISANGVQLRENNAAVASEVVSQLLPMLGSFVGVACGSDAAAKFTSSVSAAMSSGISHAGTSGRGTPGAQAAVAPSPRSQINMKDPSTWPEDPSWIVNQQPKLSLNKNPRCLQDLYTEWNNGHLNWPALRDLEEKYPRGTWRPRRANFSQQVGRIRIYNKFMPTLAAVKTLQDELYAHFQLSTAEEKGDVRWSQMRQFCDSVLRRRNEGFKIRSDERKRRKVVQMERAKAMATSAAGGKSNGE